jgi:hypothetical protein
VSPLSLLFVLLFLGTACFYLFRLIHWQTWLHSLDAENEIGHGLMALGMAVMLAPAGLLTSSLLHWNILLFTMAFLWFIGRLFIRKPFLAVLLRADTLHSPTRSDAIHALMHAGMAYMFLLFNSMTLSMSLPATYLSCFFFVSFAFLTYFYLREVSRDTRAGRKDWSGRGTNLAHLLMSGVMSWMFLEMLTMTMSMGRL